MNSEKLGIAAHLHVLLRRKTGRVTDTEWLASNLEYAREIIRFAHLKAIEDNHPDLSEWAGKLEAVMAPVLSATPAKEPASPFPASLGAISTAVGLGRYVRGLR